MLLRLRRRARAQPLVFILSALLLTCFLAFTLFGQWSDWTVIPYGTSIAQSQADLLQQQQHFWRSFYPDLISYGPKVGPLVHPEDTHLDVFFNATDARPRPDLLAMPASEMLEIREAHTRFTERLKKLEYKLPYRKHARGIATTAGGAYLPVAVVSIRMLRRTGSNLPVEVFLANQAEWDPKICEVVLPSLNSRCVVLQDFFDPADGVKIEKYQYKVMAILFSSFEDVLFIDSDCFPVFDPLVLFDAEPYTSTGLVLWPDFWFPSESPLFFEIANIDAPKVNASASTESGEILYSKSKHSLSIMLSVYYNYYGPDLYYPIQSQGAPGEGDKETFRWSAVALEEPFYLVQKHVAALGYMTTNGEWRGSAMVQFDPSQDHEATAAQESGKAAVEVSVRPFFIHANFPKFDPATIFKEEAMGATGPTKDADGTIRRVWHDTEAKGIDFFGMDVERRLWEEIRSTACLYETDFQAWALHRGVCDTAKAYWTTIFGSDDFVDKLHDVQALASRSEAS